MSPLQKPTLRNYRFPDFTHDQLYERYDEFCTENSVRKIWINSGCLSWDSFSLKDVPPENAAMLIEVLTGQTVKSQRVMI